MITDYLGREVNLEELVSLEPLPYPASRAQQAWESFHLDYVLQVGQLVGLNRPSKDSPKLAKPERKMFERVFNEYYSQEILQQIFGSYQNFFHCFFVEAYGLNAVAEDSDVKFKGRNIRKVRYTDRLPELEKRYEEEKTKGKRERNEEKLNELREQIRIIEFARTVNLPALMFACLERYDAKKPRYEFKREASIVYTAADGTQHNTMLHVEFGREIWDNIFNGNDDCISVMLKRRAKVTDDTANDAQRRERRPQEQSFDAEFHKYWFASLLHILHPNVQYLLFTAPNEDVPKPLYKVKLMETEQGHLIVGGVLGADFSKAAVKEGSAGTETKLEEFVDACIREYFLATHKAGDQLVYNLKHVAGETQPYNQFNRYIRKRQGVDETKLPAIGTKCNERVTHNLAVSGTSDIATLVTNVDADGKPRYNGEQYSETFMLNADDDKGVGAFVPLSGKLRAFGIGYDTIEAISSEKKDEISLKPLGIVMNTMDGTIYVDCSSNNSYIIGAIKTSRISTVVSSKDEIYHCNQGNITALFRGETKSLGLQDCANPQIYASEVINDRLILGGDFGLSDSEGNILISREEMRRMAIKDITFLTLSANNTLYSAVRYDDDSSGIVIINEKEGSFTFGQEVQRYATKRYERHNNERLIAVSSTTRSGDTNAALPECIVSCLDDGALSVDGNKVKGIRFHPKFGYKMERMVVLSQDEQTLELLCNYRSVTDMAQFASITIRLSDYIVTKKSESWSLGRYTTVLCPVHHSLLHQKIIETYKSLEKKPYSIEKHRKSIRRTMYGMIAIVAWIIGLAGYGALNLLGGFDKDEPTVNNHTHYKEIVTTTEQTDARPQSSSEPKINEKTDIYTEQKEPEDRSDRIERKRKIEDSIGASLISTYRPAIHRINPFNWEIYAGKQRSNDEWSELCKHISDKEDICLISILEDTLRDGCEISGGLIEMNDSYLGKRLSCKAKGCAFYSRGVSELLGESERDSTLKCVNSAGVERLGTRGLQVYELVHAFGVRYRLSDENYVIVMTENNNYALPFKEWRLAQQFVDAVIGLSFMINRNTDMLPTPSQKEEMDLFHKFIVYDGLHM